jgi:acyl-CoA hydrolase
MEITPIVTHHFVKSEDLNHHGTLFAGRTAEWFVEAGLMAAAVCIPAENIVCIKIHGMTFTRPVKLGEIAKFTSKIVYAGRTSLIANIRLSIQDQEVINGFITFVNVDKDGHSFPHGVEIKPISAEDLSMYEQAKSFRNLQTASESRSDC